METPCTFNIYRTWNPTNVEEASSMELCALIKELFELHLLSNC